MKLYADQGNFLAFRVSVAASIAGVNLEVIRHQPDGPGLALVGQPNLLPTPGLLPALQLDSGQCLFSANEAVRYLLLQKTQGSDGSASSNDTWLEWEATKLRPAVEALLHWRLYGKKSEASPEVQLCLDVLRQLLSKAETEYFSGARTISGGSQGDLGVSEVCILSCLYPLLVDVGVAADTGLLSQFPRVQAALQSYRLHPAVVRASAINLCSGSGKGGNVPFMESFARLSCAAAALAETSSSSSGNSRTAAQPQQIAAAVSASAVDSGPSTAAAATAATPEEVAAALRDWTSSAEQKLQPRVHPILPKEGLRNILITSALPYVNNVPHLGNIVGCVLSADAFSRFCRMRGYNSLFVCGTDEYGTATETKALEEGLTPQQICDKYHVLHRDIYEWFNIGFDYFGRTTTQQQTEIAQDIFWRLHKNGYLVKDSVEQLKCEACNRFLADRFVEGTCPLCGYLDARGDQCDKCGRLINAIELRSPRCKLCSSTPVVCSSQHLFLDLPQLEPQLAAYLERTMAASNSWTSNAKDITRAWLRDGLKPRCITRDLKWGTPVPLEGYTDKVFYVWFDAPIGYISITANYTDKWALWWKNPQQVDQYNFMAKDNVPFHSVIFPASLLGANDNYSIVNHLCATEYLNYEDGKFSKSRGVGVFGNDAQGTGIAADMWRFYLLYVRPETQDSAFSWDDLMTKCNSELLNNLGNFINRVLKFVGEAFGGRVPEMQPLNADDEQLIADVAREVRQYVDHLEKAQLREGVWCILNLSRLGNHYMQAAAPWKLVKPGGGSAAEDEARRQRAGVVLGLAANVAALLAALLQPYMPSTSQELQQQLGIKELSRLEAKFVCSLPAGHMIGEPKPLFTKLEASVIANLKAKFAGKQQQAAAASASVPAAAAKAAVGKAAAPSSSAPAGDAVPLSAQVEKQGNYVRQLKEQKADKAQIKAEVDKLLKLKASLAVEAAAAGAAGASNVAAAAVRSK